MAQVGYIAIEDRNTIERIIDGNTLSETLAGIAMICEDKAEHLESNWQDPNYADSYRRIARTLELLAVRVRKNEGL